jgi:uncharacterized protein
MSAGVAAPVRPDERIVTLDIIRGFALLGILVMNMPAFTASVFSSWTGSQQWSGALDQWVLHFRDVLFDGKFNSMFSCLFAVGFTLQLRRLEAREAQDAIAIYVRRLLALLAFGILHSCLLWTGDVLHIYAILGFALLAMRRWPDEAIIAVIVLTLLYPAAADLLRPEVVTDGDALLDTMRARETLDNAALGAGSYLSAVRMNTSDALFLYASPMTRRAMVGFYAMIVTTMSLGLLAGRHRWVQNAGAYRSLLPVLQWSGLAIGLLCGIVFSIGWDFVSPYERSTLRVVVSSSYALARVAMMVFYVTTLTRLALEPRWQRRLMFFATAGRMPLTNYLLQSLICTFLFYGWGLGLWQSIGWAAQCATAFAIFFLVQVPLSRWWLARHTYGPMEYLWRVLTYGRRPAPATESEVVKT